MLLRILDIPNIFRPKSKIPFPPHQKDPRMIEERAFEYFSKKKVESNLIYLPIYWTQYHINNNYGKNREELIKYCYYLNKKYPNEKFFTIVQYDGGLLVPINNCLIFASSGSFDSPIGFNSEYCPIPLLSDEHKFKSHPNKKFLASFVGSLETNDIRQKMFESLRSMDGFKIKKPQKYFNQYFYKKNMLNAHFALCPRGYGPATFRLYEAIQMKLIPIYISDEFWLPYKNLINWNKIAVLIEDNRINEIPKIINNLYNTGEYKNILDYTSLVYNDYFTWQGCLTQIEKKICS
jgi:hypothetical protein